MINICRIDRRSDHTRFYLFGLKLISFRTGLFDLSYIRRMETSYVRDIKIFKFLSQNKPAFSTLILGSSHARDDFVCDEQSFNLSGASLDLYRIYHLYLWAMKNNPSFVQNVIVFYDVFSPGLQLEKTKHALRCVPYKLFYQIPYAFELTAETVKKEKSFIKKLKKAYDKMPAIESFYRGNAEQVQYPEGSEGIQKKVEGHLKNNTRCNNQTKYIEKFAKETQKRGQNLYVITPPYRSDYSSLLPPYETLFAELLQVLQKNPNVILLNFQNDTDFDDTDFYDADHLNNKGALKLTEKIKTHL